MQSITVHSPCKINLSLDIVRRLPNGYHEMDMVMQTVDLCDTLTVSLHSGSDIQMTCAGPDGKTLPLACDDSNIAVRCTRAFFERCGFSALPYSVVIHLVKRIPMMAGHPLLPARRDPARTGDRRRFFPAFSHARLSYPHYQAALWHQHQGCLCPQRQHRIFPCAGPKDVSGAGYRLGAFDCRLSAKCV